MDSVEAARILEEGVKELREIPYSELRRLVNDREVQTAEIAGASSSQYYLEVQAFWDDFSERKVRVIAAIDDGGIRALRPLTRSFIKAPDGSFVGEQKA
jgi:hypothetical protein